MRLEEFRFKVRKYRREVERSQEDLAEAVGLNPSVLSDKLNGKPNAAPFSRLQVKSIIRALAGWQAISRRSEVVELLSLLDLPEDSFEDDEWNAAPLKKLENDVIASPPATDLGEISKLSLEQPGKTQTLPVNLARRFNNLPVPATSFIGREDQIGQVSTLLQEAGVRLLSLTGPAGTGKTRLSLEVGRRLAANFSDGVIFVALAAISDPALVVGAIAAEFGIKDTPNARVIDTLKMFLANRNLLLILDNFEQVVGAAQVVDDLIRVNPKLKVLVTSREVLHLYGEREYFVPPLKMPAPQPGLDLTETLQEYDAINLFVERARASNPRFQITTENQTAVLEVCARLDGLPLPLELAAARIKLLTPQLLLARLDNRFKILTSELTNLPPRQQTLRGAIDWSYDLLNAAEQRLFRRLGIFTGGFALDTVEAICAEPELDGLTGLGSLVDKSLVRREDAGEEPRFFLLETLREYGLAQLELNGELQEMRYKHAGYFSPLVVKAGQEIRRANQTYWLSWLNLEKENLRAVLYWSLEEKNLSGSWDSEAKSLLILGAQIAGALGWYWAFYGYLNEGFYWLEPLLAKINQLNPARDNRDYGYVKAELSYALSQMLMNSGQYDRAFELGNQALHLYEKLGDRLYSGLVLTQLASIAWYRADAAQIELYGSRAVEIGREVKAPWLEAYSIFLMGEVAKARCDFKEAKRLLEESLRGFQAIGDRVDTTIPLLHLGGLARQEKDYPRSQQLLEECIQISQEVNNIWMAGMSRLFLTDGFLEQGKLGEAQAVIDQNMEYLKHLQDDWTMSYICYQKARLYLGRGMYQAAMLEGQASLVLRQKMKDPVGEAQCRELLAEIARIEG